MADNANITVHAMDMSTAHIHAYLCALNVDEILSIAEVVRRKEDRNRGFQRNLSQRRVSQIAAYLQKPEAIIANNIIVAFGQTLSFDKESLVLPTNEEKRGWVVDGQHRLAGLQKAGWEHKVAVVILDGLSVSQMASLFRVINSTQKGVPTSLLYDLLGITKDGEFEEIRGHELAVKLNEDLESPLYNCIDMTGSGPNRISQARVVNSLKPLISPQGPFGKYTIEEQFGIISNYFSAIAARVGEHEFRNPENIFLSALGFAAFIELFTQIFTNTYATYHNFKIDSIYSTLKGLEDYNFARKEHKGLGGDAGAKMVSKSVALHLQKYQEDSDTSSIEL
jgi:DGQHR domain-containing protein